MSQFPERESRAALRRPGLTFTSIAVPGCNVGQECRIPIRW